MTLPLFADDIGHASPNPQTIAALMIVARELAERLLRPETISRRDLARVMTRAFGASDADGAWSMRDAYDALEAAQCLCLRSSPSRSLEDADGQEGFAWLRSLQSRLPTQTYRSERQIAMQQFSTPLLLSWLVARAARLGPDDHVLEPSAGTGLLAVHALRAGARLSLNDYDPKRALLLEALLACPVSRHDAEYIDDVLPGDIRPSVVLINPPFSRSTQRGIDRHAGARHLRSALLRLAPAGRCVAIMPPGFSGHGSGASGYAAIADIMRPRVEIHVGGGAFAAHGTGTDVRLLIFDKGWSGDSVHHAASDLAALLAIVDNLPERREPEGRPPPRASALLARRPALPAAGALLRGVVPARQVAPARRPAPEPYPRRVDYTARDAVRPAAEAVGHYVPWRLARIDLRESRPHPEDLVESVAMASVVPPPCCYRPLLPARAADALSDAQMETIILAGEAFERDLPGQFAPNAAGDQLIAQSGGATYRTGFSIGDGTGVGKGRESAGCIMDQWCQGRRRHVWISKSSALIEDARRDWSALGGLPIDIQGLDAFPLGAPIAMTSGILFLTYATLRSQRHDEASRLQQILAFLGEDFDGVIVFDEAHAMANAAGTDTEFGTAKGSEQGLAGVRLQNAVPRARILYVSATGATDPANLAYMTRLGLWGPGSAFGDRTAFMAAMSDGGIAAMEIVARDTKVLGLYIARALSFAGIEYQPAVHILTDAQIDIYDAYADGWAVIHSNLEDVLKATGIVDRMSGEVLNGQARGAALSRFESAKQRFFSQLLISMKMPTLIREIEAELAQGHVAVVQLVTTSEAILERRLAALPAEERAALDLDLSPREALIDYLRHAFPTRQMRTFRDSGGTVRSELMVDAEGAPVLCQAAIRAREDLIEQLCAMPPVVSALDALLGHFGTAQVSEVTGRSRRVVTDADGRQTLERRSARANLAETDAFMAGHKPILVFSDAGGTGRSYHADRGCGSADRRRIHFLLEPGWRAASAIQGLGRTHRTNQVTPPVFRPVTTDCRGERRFISTIARRLDSLGALTRGQRQTGGQNLFDPADNLESDLAREALVQWYHLLHAGKLASTTLATFCAMTGLALVDGDSGSLREQLPPIQRWLNRILALRIAVQNAIFEEYMGLLQTRIEAARAAGTLDVGVEAIAAERVVVLEDQLLRHDPVSGAETRLQHLELHLRRHPTSFERLMAIWGGTTGIDYLRNSRSGRVALCAPSWSMLDDNGNSVPMLQLVRPTGRDRIEGVALARSHWHPVNEDAFREGWDAEVTEARSVLDVERIHIATGLLLPVWNRLPGDDVRVWRIVSADGSSLIGRIIRPGALGQIGVAFGLRLETSLTPAEYLAAAEGRDGVAIAGLAPARLKTVLVNGQRRYELRDFPADRRPWLKALGCSTEIIAYKTRLFLPRDMADQILEQILSFGTDAAD